MSNVYVKKILTGRKGYLLKGKSFPVEEKSIKEIKFEESDMNPKFIKECKESIKNLDDKSYFIYSAFLKPEFKESLGAIGILYIISKHPKKFTEPRNLYANHHGSLPFNMFSLIVEYKK